MPPSPSPTAAHRSRSGKPLSALNARSELSASALLSASAAASSQLERLLRGESAARTRSRSRTRSPHKAALVDQALAATSEPFLVHTALSTHSLMASTHASSSTPKHRSSSHRHREDSATRHRSTKPKRRDTDTEATSVASSSVASAKPHRSSHSRTREERDRERARKDARDLERERERSSKSKHRHHNKTRSLSRTRKHSASHHAASAHLSPSEYKSAHRSRSRSHSRNRYPDGLAPPLQAVGGGADYELRSKFASSFEHEHDGHHHHYNGYERSPPMSPRRLDARAAYEHDLRARAEDAELRRQMEYAHIHSHGRDPRDLRDPRDQGYDEWTAEEARRYAAYPRREYGFESGPLGPDNRGEDEAFELEAPRPEEPMSADMTWAGQSGVLVCALCEARYEDPDSGSLAGNGKVPRYLLCGHTFCTGCLAKLVEVQQDLHLSTTSGLTAPGITPTTQKLGSVSSGLVLPCPVGACGPTPLTEHGVLSLPVNTAFLDVSRFLRSRRAAGHGLRDAGAGRGDERGEEERIRELNDELTADAKVQHGLAQSYGLLATSLPCQQCAVHLAALFCQACNVRFCAACSASVHVGRALAEHVKRGLVLPLNVARARGLLGTITGGGAVGSGTGAPHQNAGLHCPSHTDQPLSLYCRTCQLPVCRDCVTPLFKGQHLPPGHDVDLLATVLAGTASELRSAVGSVEGTIARLERTVAQAAGQVAHVAARADEVRSELKDAFTLIRTAVFKALAEREAKLEAELASKSRAKEARIHAHRGDLAKVLVTAQAAREEAVRVLASAADEPTDVFAIKALLDVRAAINAGSIAALPPAIDGGGIPQQDVLLRVKPRELIRLVEAQIAKQGGVIAALPAEPSFVSFAASGTSLVLSWAPAHAPAEGEVLEYALEVCELPRGWRSKLRALQPALFPDPTPDEDFEQEIKWDGSGPLQAKSRAAVNWLALPPGNVNVGGAEQMWKLAGGAGWAGAFTTLYSGEVTTVKHDNLNLNSAYIYRLSVKNDLGASGHTYSMPCTLPCMLLNYGSDMDSAGLVTYLGSHGGAQAWANPCISPALLEVSASSVQLGECSALTSRAAGTFQTLNRHLSWVRVDLARGQPLRLLLTHYTLANCGRGVGARRVLRSWALQASQNGADWVTLREHDKDATLAATPLATATWSVQQPTPEPYRFFRVLQTDVNAAGDHHLALGQIELYGWLVRD